MTHSLKATSSLSLIDDVESLVKAHMAQYDPSHDWHHVHRVRNMALNIARAMITQDEVVDLQVVEIAALLHDLTDAKYGPQTSLAEMMKTIFENQSEITFQQKENILRIVPAVSYTTEMKLRASGEWLEWHQTCLELHAVQDADRLDAIGAVGVLRCAAFSGVRGRHLVEDLPGVAGPGCEGHFYDKLLKVKGYMKTCQGRTEAELRHSAMLAFLGALDRERQMWGNNVS